MNLPRTYSIVENPGLESEDIVETGLSFDAAMKYLKDRYRAGESADAALEMPNGSLEYIY
jgi:hypothetical protein